MDDMTELHELITQQGEVFEKIVADHKTMKAELDHLQKMAGRAPLFGTTGSGGDAAEEYKAIAKFIRTRDASDMKSLSVGSDPDGGYTVLPVVSDGMTKRLYDMSPMRRICRVEQITSGDAFEEIDDRDEIGATWVGESQARPATDTPQLGKWRVPVEEIYALQPITQRLLEDSGRNLGQWVIEKITDKFGRSEGTAFATGDGIKKPRGFLSYDKVTDGDFTRARGKLQYVKTGNATGFAASDPADVLRTLMWTLRAPYRRNAVWQMNSNTASVVDKFKNSNGDYIWRDGMTAGAPPSLLGYPVEFNEDMPDLGADAFPISFGDMRLGYCIVEKVGIKVLDDPYTSKPNVLFYAWKRVGGGLANDDAIKLLKCEA